MIDQARLIPIGEVEPRELVTVSGVIRRATAMALRGCPACRYALADGTGELDLIFLGRVGVAGFELGRRCVAEGRAAVRDDRIVLWNPRYQLAADQIEPDDGLGAVASGLSGRPAARPPERGNLTRAR